MIKNEKIDKISDLFMDLAKGLFLAAFAVSFLTKSDIIIFVKYILSAVTSAWFAIRILDLKKE